MVEIKIKLDKGATMPVFSKDGDAGRDLVATSVRYDDDEHFIEYGTGVYVAIPKGYEFQVRPRSSISKYDVIIVNSPGTIDSNYRGEIKVRMKLLFDYTHAGFSSNDTFWCYNEDNDSSMKPKIYEVGERVAQIVLGIVPESDLVLADELDETNRGSTGFGDSGK